MDNDRVTSNIDCPILTYSRESSLLLALSHRGALTVGFGFGAAANPKSATELSCPQGHHDTCKSNLQGNPAVSFCSQ